jgi:hypothetical protein
LTQRWARMVGGKQLEETVAKSNDSTIKHTCCSNQRVVLRKGKTLIFLILS